MKLTRSMVRDRKQPGGQLRTGAWIDGCANLLLPNVGACFACSHVLSILFCLTLAPATPAEEPGMVLIPGGDFLRGRTHELPDDGLELFPTLLKDERPVRRIVVDPFYLDMHEVTNRQYAEYLEATRRAAPFYWPDGKPPLGKEDYPVVNVTWDEASAYCQWAGKRLPTEVEWERAARGREVGLKYPWGDQQPSKQEHAQFDGIDGPCAVARFPKYGYGLHDMAGNVWEWCADWYERDYYSRAPHKNPMGPEQGFYRVLRGGCWADGAKYLTCSYRSYARPQERSPTIGFRCAKSFSGQ